jgi:hypothetical protein
MSQVQHLTRIHHKNLVSLIGYCKDKNHLALVYEYMPEGNLQDHLRGCLWYLFKYRCLYKIVLVLVCKIINCLCAVFWNSSCWGMLHFSKKQFIDPKSSCSYSLHRCTFILEYMKWKHLTFISNLNVFNFFSSYLLFDFLCLDTSTSKPLTWEQRLQIALDAAQGMNKPSYFLRIPYTTVGKTKTVFTSLQVWSTCMLRANQHWFTEMWRVGTSSWPKTLGLRLLILVSPRLSATQRHISPLNQLVQWATWILSMYLV